MIGAKLYTVYVIKYVVDTIEHNGKNKNMYMVFLAEEQGVSETRGWWRQE